MKCATTKCGSHSLARFGLSVLRHAVVLCLTASVLSFVYIAAVEAQSISVPLTPDRLVLSQRNFKIPELKTHEHNGEVVNFLGRPSLRLARGLIYARDIDFQNGTID